jgi:GNAT superfamily N-acetyltransferase
MDHIIFRSALVTDLPAIIELLADDELARTRETVSSPADERYVAAFKTIEANPNQRLVVAVDGETVIGTMQISFMPGIARRRAWRGQIEAVRIAASRRGSGLGQQMLEWAISDAGPTDANSCS